MLKIEDVRYPIRFDSRSNGHVVFESENKGLWDNGQNCSLGVGHFLRCHNSANKRGSSDYRYQMPPIKEGTPETWNCRSHDIAIRSGEIAKQVMININHAKEVKDELMVAKELIADVRAALRTPEGESVVEQAKALRIMADALNNLGK